MGLFFYTLLVSALYVVALPFLLLLTLKTKHRIAIPSRFFLKNNPPFEKEGIWFHACSLGEVNSLKPIFEKLQGKEINLSVITGTGYTAAKKIEGVNVRFLPFEIFLPFWMKKNQTLVVTEAELWPMLFAVAKLKGVKTILVNARVSDNSYNSYKRFSWLYRWIFSYVDEVLAQSEKDAHRLKVLGAKNITVNGNIKTFSSPKVTKELKKPVREVICMASSHEGEEKLLLESFPLDTASKMLVVVPRHPERFSSVEKLLKEYCYKHNYSFSKLSEEESFESDVVLCDKMGELVNIYAIADTTLLCGSFLPGIGGHNPLEPAYFGSKIISGEYVFNQKPLFKLVENIYTFKAEELQKIDTKELKPSRLTCKGDMNILLEKL